MTQNEEEKSEITKLQEALKAEQDAHIETKRELHATMMFVQRIPQAFQMMGQGFTSSASELFNYSQAVQTMLSAYYQRFAQYSSDQQQNIVRGGGNTMQQPPPPGQEDNSTNANKTMKKN